MKNGKALASTLDFPPSNTRHFKDVFETSLGNLIKQKYFIKFHLIAKQEIKNNNSPQNIFKGFKTKEI